MVIAFLLALGPRVMADSAQGGGRAVDAHAKMVPGELIVQLRSDFPACAHCLLEHGQGFAATTGNGVLDQVLAGYGVQELKPLFGGVHAAAQRRAAQRRFGRLAAGQGGDAAGRLGQTYLVRVAPDADLLRVAADLRRDANVVSAEPNFLYHTDGLAKGVGFTDADRARPSTHRASRADRLGTAVTDPDDPFFVSAGSWGQSFSDLWGLFQIEAPAAWELATGAGIIVAVVDTGLDVSHPDLAANVWHNPGEIADNGIDDDDNGFVDDVTGWDFTRCARRYAGGTCMEGKDPGPNVLDPVGHGTHVAGTIAAVGGNGIGMIGAAPDATVMAVKGLDQRGLGASSDLRRRSCMRPRTGPGSSMRAGPAAPATCWRPRSTMPPRSSTW